MQIDEKPKFLEAILGLASLFSRELDDAAIMLYWDAVRRMSLEDFRVAVRVAAKVEDHFPPPAVLLALTSVKASLMAANAWPEVMAKARNSSGNHSDPIAAEAIRLMGGGKRLGQMAEEDLEVWGRKRFEELYQDLVEAKEREPLGIDRRLPPDEVAQRLGVNSLADLAGSVKKENG